MPFRPQRLGTTHILSYTAVLNVGTRYEEAYNMNDQCNKSEAFRHLKVNIGPGEQKHAVWSRILKILIRTAAYGLVSSPPPSFPPSFPRAEIMNIRCT